MEIDRLGPMDVSFLYAETDQTPMHVGALIKLKGNTLFDDQGRLRFDEMRRGLDVRLSHAPRFRKKLHELPFDATEPVWVDDPDFDIANHVRHIAVPAAGGDDELRALMTQIQEQPLPRNRPLWEMYMVDGLASDQATADGAAGPDTAAIIAKVHHSMIDGVAGVQLAGLLFDIQADAASVETAPWQPEPQPGAWSLLRSDAAERVRSQAQLAGRAKSALGDVKVLPGQLRRAIDAVRCLTMSVPPGPFSGRVSARRHFETTSLQLADVRTLAKAAGVTINDVVVACVTGGLRRYLDYLGAVDIDTLRVVMPVNTRSGVPVGLGNQASVMLADLPLDTHSPIERLQRVHAETLAAKSSSVPAALGLFADVVKQFPKPLARRIARDMFGRSIAHLSVSNVPGPPVPLYSMGAQVTELVPYAGVTNAIGMIVAVLSYNKTMHFGITVDPELAPDMQVFAEGIVASFEELHELMAELL